MLNLLRVIIDNRKMILSLAKSDFKKRFVGSFFGIIWMFVQPLATVLVYTLIFQVGFRATPPIENIPYVVWLIAGLVPWFYFQDSLIQNTNCLNEYSYLVKKVVFNVNLLPVIKLCSTFIAHLFFLVILFLALLIARVPFDIRFLLIFYFSFSLSILALGLSYMFSCINVFFKDMTQIVNILLQFGIWMCPIMYDENLFINRAPLVIKLLKLNPIYYIVKGYRYSVLNDNFDSLFKMSIYYYIISIIVFIIGFSMFDKMKKHFADVL